jgi:integrase
VSVEIQSSLWESVPVAGQSCTSFAPVGVVRPKNRTMTTQAERIAELPAGQQVLRAGKRWRAFWTVQGADGIRRRRSQRFDSAAEALAHLDAMPRRPVAVTASRRTLRDAVVDLQQRGRGGHHTQWVLDECADLLGIHLDDPRLRTAIEAILTRRATRRRAQGKPSARWELACAVQKQAEGWARETDKGWELLKPDSRRAAVFAPKLDRLLTHLTNGGSGMTTDLPVPPAFLRTHDKGSSTLRGLLRSVPAERQNTQAVSRATVLDCRAMLNAALPQSLRDAIPDPREIRVQSESKSRKRKRELTASLGGRGLEPDPVSIERVLREARRLGSLPREMVNPKIPESLTHLNARRAVALIAATGMRSGEARALQWRDLDLTANRLWVDSSLDQNTQLRKSPKTEESRRELRVEFASLRGLGDGLLDDLREWRGSAPDTAWVFPREDGKPMRREALLDAVKELATGLGLRKGLRVHDLRHCWARYALHLCGVDVAKVSKALGHASIVITLDLYGSAVEGLMD